MAAPFVGAGIAELGAIGWRAIKAPALNVAAHAALTYYRLAPAIGAAGKMFAEAFYESGAVMTDGSGGVRFTETAFQEGKGLLGAAFKFEGGETLEFLSNKIANGNTLELTDAIGYIRDASVSLHQQCQPAGPHHRNGSIGQLR